MTTLEETVSAKWLRPHQRVPSVSTRPRLPGKRCASGPHHTKHDSCGLFTGRPHRPLAITILARTYGSIATWLRSKQRLSAGLDDTCPPRAVLIVCSLAHEAKLGRGYRNSAALHKGTWQGVAPRPGRAEQRELVAPQSGYWAAWDLASVVRNMARHRRRRRDPPNPMPRRCVASCCGMAFRHWPPSERHRKRCP